MKSLARFFGLYSDKDDKVKSVDEFGKNTDAAVNAEEVVPEINDCPVDTVLAGDEVKNDSVELSESDSNNDIQHLKVEDILPNPFQPRKTFSNNALNDLCDSIREFGVIQPLIVRKIADSYELVAGERRLRASKLAGLVEVPVIVKELTDKEIAELAMIENLQREDLHFLEEAEGFQKLLVNFSYTQDELAKRMGKSQSTIANKLRLLKLSGAVREKIAAENLTERHARALLKLPDERSQVLAIDYVLEKELNVRETEILIQAMLEECVEEAATKKKARRNVVRVVRDARIFINTIDKIVSEMKKNGLNINVDREQDDEYITLKMRIPVRKK